MKIITFTRNGEEHKIAYSDYGHGAPVVLIHGWPLSREMWEYQLEDIVDAHQALHGLVKQQQRRHEAREIPRCQSARLDPRHRIGQQPHDRHRAE